jgi:Flp pilus assembly protein TadB
VDVVDVEVDVVELVVVLVDVLGALAAVVVVTAVVLVVVPDSTTSSQRIRLSRAVVAAVSIIANGTHAGRSGAPGMRITAHRSSVTPISHTRSPRCRWPSATLPWSGQP